MSDKTVVADGDAAFLKEHKELVDSLDQGQRDLVMHVLGALAAYQGIAGSPGLIQVAVNEYLIQAVHKTTPEDTDDEPPKAA